MAPAAAEARSARHKRGRCGTIHAASLSGGVMALGIATRRLDWKLMRM